MRRIRFSLKWLLILLTFVGVSLYVLYVRPTAAAEQFSQQLKTATDLETVGEQYFVGMDPDGTIVESDLPRRTGADVLSAGRISPFE
jgi:hypothetical protein